MEQTEKPNDLDQFIFDERFIIDHLVSLINTTRISPISKKIKINSCGSHDGKYVYFDVTVVWNLVKDMYIQLAELEKPSNELVRTTINYMLENKLMYKKDIVITNKAESLRKRTLILTAYRFYHEKLYKTKEEIMLSQREAEHIRHNSVYEDYFYTNILPTLENN